MQSNQTVRRATSNVGSGVAFFIVGYPGAGKTTVAEAIGDYLDGQDREQAVVDIIEEVNNIRNKGHEKEILEYGAEYYCLEITNKFELEDRSAVVFDGVNCLEEMEYFRLLFEDVHTIFVDAFSIARHTRLNKRERERDDGVEYSRTELLESDLNAEASGIAEIERLREYDDKIRNNDTEVKELKLAARTLAHDLLH